MSVLRLDRIISESMPVSRSEAAALIKRGQVAVNAVPVKSGSSKIDTSDSVITVNGITITYKRYRYIMMNKPAGVVSSTDDKRDRTVIDLLDEEYRSKKLFPVGRLDKDAEGMLILTNDGDYAHKVLSPVKKVAKRYYVKCDGEITAEDIGAFSDGLTLKDGYRCKPAKLEADGQGGVYVTLREGKYHQVKRMMAAVGKPVEYLKRVSIGGLILDEGLPPGGYRELSEQERASVFDNW